MKKIHFIFLVLGFIFNPPMPDLIYSEEYISFNFYHTSPEFLMPGEDFIVKIIIYEPENVSFAFLSYRNSEMSNFKILMLKREGAIFTARIPSEDIKPPWLEYFISAIDIKNQPHTLFHSHKNPLRVSVYSGIPGKSEAQTPQEIRVTLPSGYEQNLRESSLDITEVDRKNVELLCLNSPAQCIKNYAGMDMRVVRNGFLHSGIRGFAERNNQYMMMIDGRKLSFYQRILALNGLTLLPDEIQDIEILRGPGSYIYGSGAQAGVIDIKSTTPDMYKNIQGMISAGNLHSIFSHISLAGKFYHLATVLTGNFIQSNFYEDQDKNAISGGFINFKNIFSPYYNFKLTLNGGYSRSILPVFTTRGIYDLSLESSYAQTQLNFNKLHLNTYWNSDNLFDFTPYQYGTEDKETFRTKLQPLLIRTDEFRLESTYSFAIGPWSKILTGGEVNASVYQVPPGSKNTFTERNAGIFVLDEIRPFDKLMLTLSYRFDWNSVTDPGNSFLGSITIIPDNNNTFRLSIREGYRKPEYLEYKNSETPLTNEILTTTQLDYKFMSERFNFTFNLFYNKYRNFIELFSTTGLYRNVAEDVWTYGGEITINFVINKYLTFFTNYSALKGIDKSREEDPNHLNPDLTNPNHIVNSGILFENIENFSGSITVNFTTGYKENLFLPDVQENDVSNFRIDYVSPYAALNLKTGYSIISNRLEIGIYGTNILFYKHQEVSRIEEEINGENRYLKGEKVNAQISGYVIGKF